jgi:hypothetical protein
MYLIVTDMPYPCMGNMFALRGTDGEVIWKTYTRSAGIFMNCEDFDINQDGQKDCIISGRRGTIQAVDTKDGKYNSYYIVSRFSV